MVFHCLYEKLTFSDLGPWGVIYESSHGTIVHLHLVKQKEKPLSLSNAPYANGASKEHDSWSTEHFLQIRRDCWSGGWRSLHQAGGRALCNWGTLTQVRVKMALGEREKGDGQGLKLTGTDYWASGKVRKATNKFIN